ncbi:hypothetical protein ACNKHQ_17390 [Shigella flexneri]
MHLIYLHATDKVMRDDNLLALFDIPKILWPRLRLFLAAPSPRHDHQAHGALHGRTWAEGFSTTPAPPPATPKSSLNPRTVA